MSIFKAKEMVFITIYFKQKSMNVSLRWCFIKLNNDWYYMQMPARATEQKYISIYIFLWRKTFLKTRLSVKCIFLPLIQTNTG